MTQKLFTDGGKQEKPRVVAVSRYIGYKWAYRREFRCSLDRGHYPWEGEGQRGFEVCRLRLSPWRHDYCDGGGGKSSS